MEWRHSICVVCLGGAAVNSSKRFPMHRANAGLGPGGRDVKPIDRVPTAKHPTPPAHSRASIDIVNTCAKSGFAVRSSASHERRPSSSCRASAQLRVSAGASAAGVGPDAAGSGESSAAAGAPGTWDGAHPTVARAKDAQRTVRIPTPCHGSVSRCSGCFSERSRPPPNRRDSLL